MGRPPQPPPEADGASPYEVPPTASDETGEADALPTASLEEPPSDVPRDEALALVAHARALAAEESQAGPSTQPGSLDPVDLSFVEEARPAPVEPVAVPAASNASGGEKLRAIVLGLGLGTVAGLVVVAAAARWLG